MLKALAIAGAVGLGVHGGRKLLQNPDVVQHVAKVRDSARDAVSRGIKKLRKTALPPVSDAAAATVAAAAKGATSALDPLDEPLKALRASTEALSNFNRAHRANRKK